MGLNFDLDGKLYLFEKVNVSRVPDRRTTETLNKNGIPYSIDGEFISVSVVYIRAAELVLTGKVS